MFRPGQLVLDLVTHTRSVILKINFLKKKATVLNLETLCPCDRYFTDLEPWDPPSGGGGGAAVPRTHFSEEDVDGIISLLERHNTLAPPREIEYKTRTEQIALNKVMRFHAALYPKKRVLVRR